MSVHQKVRSYRMYRVSVVLAVSAVVVIMGNYLGLYIMGNYLGLYIQLVGWAQCSKPGPTYCCLPQQSL